MNTASELSSSIAQMHHTLKSNIFIHDNNEYYKGMWVCTVYHIAKKSNMIQVVDFTSLIQVCHQVVYVVHVSISFTFTLANQKCNESQLKLTKDVFDCLKKE